MKGKRCKSIHPSFHLSLIALIFILSNSGFLLSGVNATESNQPYSHINLFTRGQTRYEVNLTLSRGLLLINDTNSYHLSLTPHPFDKYPNVTLDMIEISSIRFDFYKEDRETLTASTDLFYTSTMYNRSKIPVPYGNTTTLVGNFGIPDWWESKTMWLGLAVDYGEFFHISTGDNYSAAVSSHSPKLFGPLEIQGFSVSRIDFGSISVIIGTLVFLVLYSVFLKKLMKY